MPVEPPIELSGRAGQFAGAPVDGRAEPSRLPPPPSPPPTETAAVAAAPLFRARHDIPKDAAKRVAGIPAVIPIVRAPDDPGIDEDPVGDEFAEQINPAQGQAGGWRGFLSRWGG